MTNYEIDREGRYTTSSSVQLDIKQFNKLRAIEPELPCREIAHRMASTPKEVRKLLNFFGDKRK